jgi:C-terminal processing protease CtpA/Prc
VKLSLRTPAGTAYELTLPRARADDSPLRGPSMREPRLERFARPAPGVVYLDLDRYRDDDFSKDLAEVQKADGVIFDVRGYPQVSPYVLRLFAPRPWVQDRYSDVITLRPDRRAVALEPYQPPVTKPVVPPWKAKVAFLTDGRAVSYAETFLAVAGNTKIGTIVGEPTAGSNGGIALYVLPDGTRVSWTGQKAVRADGGRLHGVGIQPAVTVRRTLKGLAAGRDEALDKAVDLVRPPG